MPKGQTKRDQKISEEIKAQLKNGKSKPEAEQIALKKNSIAKTRLKAK